MPTYTLKTDKQGTWTFNGDFLASDSSQSSQHNHPGAHIAKGVDEQGRKLRCNACRWHEVALYITDDDDYILFTRGATIVPNEIDYARMVRTSSAFELLELATVRAASPYIPATTARVLARAAENDRLLREAYINRAVV